MKVIKYMINKTKVFWKLPADVFIFAIHEPYLLFEAILHWV